MVYVNRGENSMYDVIIIGSGVSGSSIARELSRYEGKICVIDKASDIGEGTSKANSGICHSGFDAKSGTLKAQLNIKGNKMMNDLSQELDFPFEQNGSLVVALEGDKIEELEELCKQGTENGVEGLRVLSQQEVRDMEPNIAEGVIGALYAPTGGIVCPFGLNLAFAENASINGVEFKLDTEVLVIEKKDNYWLVKTSKGDFETNYVVNAAGVYADVFHNMVSKDKIQIIPRRGDYCLLDKTVGSFVKKTIFQLPNEFGKGVLVSPTTHGNIIVGPTAMDIKDKEGTNTTQEGLDFLQEKANRTVKGLPLRQVITSFAGLRAHEINGDYVIGEVEGAPGFFDCAGIESPGLTASPAIGVYIADLVEKKANFKQKTDFISSRKGIKNPKLLSMDERNQLIRKEPTYGTIICRCEMISEGEILDAIHRPLGARTLDGVKRRTRAGMGRCQSGFCSPKTMEILERELMKKSDEIRKSGVDSVIVVGKNKDQVLGGN